MLRFKSTWVAPSFLQSANGGASSLTGLNASSYMAGGTAWRGLATVSSGTNIASVSAAAVRSGDIIHVSPYMYASGVNSGANLHNPIVGSVRTGGFTIFMAGSVCPSADMPVAWSVIR